MSQATIKYPNVEVELTKCDGNAFAVMGEVQKKLRKASVPETEVDAFLNEAMSGDYDELLVTCMKWVKVS
jgi:hypothetical protein